MPRHLNFIDLSRQFSRFQRENVSEIMVVDPGLYMSESGITILSEKREMPGFRTYSGSSLMALSHSFVEYCVWGWDNFPRTLLMYQANSISSAETYFQTVICNSLEFADTIVNTDLHFTARDNDDHPRSIRNNDLGPMWKSYAPFARKFDGSISYHVRFLIDDILLFRGPVNDILSSRGSDMLVPGGWCAGTDGRDRCMKVGDVTKLKPGPGAIRLQRFFDLLVQNGSLSTPQCKILR